MANKQTTTAPSGPSQPLNEWLDRVEFTVNPETHASLLTQLDASTATNERLKRTMTARAPWDEESCA